MFGGAFACSLADVRQSTPHFVFGLDNPLCPSFLATLITAVSRLRGGLTEFEFESDSASESEPSFDSEIAEANFLVVQAEQIQDVPLADLVAAAESDVEEEAEAEMDEEGAGA